MIFSRGKKSVVASPTLDSWIECTKDLKDTIASVSTSSIKNTDNLIDISAKIDQKCEAAWNSYIAFAKESKLLPEEILTELNIETYEKVKALEPEIFVKNVDSLIEKTLAELRKGNDENRDDVLTALIAGAKAAKIYIRDAKTLEQAKPGGAFKTLIFGTVGSFVGGAVGAVSGLAGAIITEFTSLGMAKPSAHIDLMSLPITGCVAGVNFGAKKGASLAGNELLVRKMNCIDALQKVISSAEKAKKGIVEKLPGPLEIMQDLGSVNVQKNRNNTM